MDRPRLRHPDASCGSGLVPSPRDLPAISPRLAHLRRTLEGDDATARHAAATRAHEEASRAWERERARQAALVAQWQEAAQAAEAESAERAAEVHKLDEARQALAHERAQQAAALRKLEMASDAATRECERRAVTIAELEEGSRAAENERAQQAAALRSLELASRSSERERERQAATIRKLEEEVREAEAERSRQAEVLREQAVALQDEMAAVRSLERRVSEEGSHRSPQPTGTPPSAHSKSAATDGGRRFAVAEDDEEGDMVEGAGAPASASRTIGVGTDVPPPSHSLLRHTAASKAWGNARRRRALELDADERLTRRPAWGPWASGEAVPGAPGAILQRKSTTAIAAAGGGRYGRATTIPLEVPEGLLHRARAATTDVAVRSRPRRLPLGPDDRRSPSLPRDAAPFTEMRPRATSVL